MNSRATLYERLLPTLGARALPALFRRLRKAAVGQDDDLVVLAAGAIASVGGEGAGRDAADLLSDASPFVRRAAMKVLARHPAPGCLDQLWTIHRAVTADSAGFLRQGEHHTAPYSDSFNALLECVKLEPDWLSAAVRRADPAQPVHDLAYLLGNLEGQAALWLGCKPHFFQKVQPRRERSLACNIFRHRDANETQWLIDRVSRQDDFLGPWALRALCRIDPDAAVRELPRLPVHLWGLTGSWCFAEIMRQRPDQARECVRRMLENPGATRVVTVYHDTPNVVDLDTLNVLLDRLSFLLGQELLAQSELPSRSAALNVLCELLPRMNRLEHLECFERRQGSLLEVRLTSWLLRQGPITDEFARPDRDNGARVLAKIGGGGFTCVVNRHLNSTNFHARLGALRDAARRPDWETRARLVYLSQKDEVHATAGPVEQGHAALALIAAGESAFAAEAVIRWGLHTPPSLVKLLASVPFDEATLAPALAALEEGGERVPGAVLALGTARQSQRKTEISERVRSTLSSAPRDSGVAHACVVALWLLGDRSDQAVGLVAPHLEVPAHRRDALNVLLNAGSDAANEALLAHLGRCFDVGLASYLLGQPRSSCGAAHLIRRALAKGQSYERSDLILQLLIHVRDSRALEAVIDDPSASDALHEVAFSSAERSMIWFVGARAAAIRHLARFDAQVAWEAARAALEDAPGKDRERYPDVLAEIDPLRAAPFLLNRLRVEEDRRIRWAVGRAFSELIKWPAADVPGTISAWIESGDRAQRRAACEVSGWLPTVYTSADPALRARLNDVDERVAAAAQEALSRLRDAEHVCELAQALTAEGDESRRWRLLDALIGLADPGDEHQGAPDWTRQMSSSLSPAMLEYLVKGLTRRRNELIREAARG